MGRFFSFLHAIEKTERKLVLVKLKIFASASSLNGQFHRNLDEERLVSDDVWRDVVKAILDSSTDPSKLRDAIRAAFRKHLFSGPRAKCSRHAIFGRATTCEDLARTFAAKHYFGSFPGALSHVRTMKRRELPALREKWRDFHLASYVMWSTFDPAGGRPFQGLKRSSQFLRALFGLDKTDSPSSLILLEYTIPDGSIARVPTIVEAYAGEWLYHFRPAGPFEIEAGYGRTYVWDELARCGESGRPEVVHEPVTGFLLTSEIEEVG